jgi:hypothetical protein
MPLAWFIMPEIFYHFEPAELQLLKKLASPKQKCLFQRRQIDQIIIRNDQWTKSKSHDFPV